MNHFYLRYTPSFKFSIIFHWFFIFSHILLCQFFYCARILLWSQTLLYNIFQRQHKFSHQLFLCACTHTLHIHLTPLALEYYVLTNTKKKYILPLERYSYHQWKDILFLCVGQYIIFVFIFLQWHFTDSSIDRNFFDSWTGFTSFTGILFPIINFPIEPE